MSYQELEGKSACACVSRIYYRHLPFRCLDFQPSCLGMAVHPSSCLALVPVGDGALAAAGGLVLQQPWRGYRKPSKLLFLHKMFGWFVMFSFSKTHFPPAVLAREKVQPELGSCCWPPSVQAEGSGELTPTLPSKTLGWSQVLYPNCAVLKQLVQLLLRESYFGMPAFLSQGTGSPERVLDGVDVCMTRDPLKISVRIQ